MRVHYGREPREERRGRMVIKSGRQQGHVQVKLPEEGPAAPETERFCTLRLPVQQARILGQLLLDASGAADSGEHRVRVSVPSVQQPPAEVRTADGPGETARKPDSETEDYERG